MHSVHVLHVDEPGSENSQVLATEIDGAECARNIVRKLARSYSEHGTDRSEMVHWFRDAAGLHYIWAELENFCSDASSNVFLLPLPDWPIQQASEDSAVDLYDPRNENPLRRAA